MAISVINNLSMNRSDAAVADDVWTATSATASDFQAAAAGGKVLQSVRATTTSIISSANSLSDKTYSANNAVTDGVQILTVSITPASTTSHFYVQFYEDQGTGNNSVAVSMLFHASTCICTASQNAYSSDGGSMALGAYIDTTSLSGSQTIQARNMGGTGSQTHYTNADSGGSAKTGANSYLIVMEVED